mmetsp:Transcript_9343/g.21724  ORF Transcript_9343/g.21724 Transcript_9343/m.21724 type:complete len:141 (-) Transcript_9343:1119-1541(-)
MLSRHKTLGLGSHACFQVPCFKKPSGKSKLCNVSGPSTHLVLWVRISSNDMALNDFFVHALFSSSLCHLSSTKPSRFNVCIFESAFLFDILFSLSTFRLMWQCATVTVVVDKKPSSQLRMMLLYGNTVTWMLLKSTPKRR